MELYKGKCGTKSTFGTISDKLDQKPHLSEFVKNNIIGANIPHLSIISKQLFDKHHDKMTEEFYDRMIVTENNNIISNGEPN